MESNENEWELSKENIQPLMQGRKVAILSDALDETHHRKLAVKRHEFEKELRTYSGDDPLDIWYRYALWIEQNFPKGGKDGNLKKLLDSCFSNLTSTSLIDKYKNDDRLLDLWIKYANQSPSPLEIYQILSSRNFCTELAKFYEVWAWEVEKVKNYTKANSIYLEGIQKRAKPLEYLEMSHKKFQARATQHVFQNEEESQLSYESSEPNRVALSSLKSKGSKARAPIERTGNSVIGSAGQIYTDPSKPNNALAPKFQIFQDENAHISKHDSIQPAGNPALPNKIISNKENEKKTSRWMKNKFGQRSIPFVSVDDVQLANQQNFKFYVDESDPNAKINTPAKPDISKALSVKKDFDEWVVPLFIAEEFDPNVQPQYDKHKVYCGTEEFSFEELRAAKELAKEKERQQEEEKRAMKEELEQLKNMFLQQSQKIAKQQELIEKLQHQQQMAPKKGLSQKAYEDSWLVINKSINVTHNVSHNPHISSLESEKLLPSQPPPDLGLLPVNETLPEIPSALEMPSFETQNQSSTKSGAPSPTVNTKFAQNVINNMLSGSIFHDSAAETANEDKFLLGSNAAVQKQESNSPKSQIMSTSTPFTIYCDNGNASNTLQSSSRNPLLSTKTPLATFPSSCDASTPFAIYCDGESASKESQTTRKPTEAPERLPFAIYCDNDGADKLSSIGASSSEVSEVKENLPPSDYIVPDKRKNLVGVLQPSIGIPFKPLEDQKSPEVEPSDNLEEMDGMTNQIPKVDDDFTIKLPSGMEAFDKWVKISSTPAPWTFGSGAPIDDDTLALPLMKGRNLSDDREQSPEMEYEKLPSANESKLTEEYEDSGEAMPPPPTIVVTSESFSDYSALTEKTCAATYKTQALSPILEGSREYGSSSSDSSSGTLISHSNIHGITHFSHHGNITSASQGHLSTGGIANCLSTYDATKSGYFADKSCETPRTALGRKSLHQGKRTDSFDPGKVAAALLLCDEEPMVTEKAEDLHNLDDPNYLLKGPFIYPDEIDPFCETFQQSLLSCLKIPLEKRAGFISLNAKMPQVKTNSTLSFGNEKYFDCRLKGSGSYAHVYQVSTNDPMNVTTLDDCQDDLFNKSHMILKVQRPAAFWEFYICSELRERLKASGSRLYLDSFMRTNRGYFFTDGSILVSTYHKYGTLLNIVNGYKKAGKSIPQSVSLYYTLQLLILIERLHSCEIIHGDMKPDNILIVDNPAALTSEEDFFNSSTCIKLIDFGRSIDMKVLPKEASFVKKVKTDGFQCCEMKDGRCWNYQTDLFGAAAVAHTLLWGSYMNVRKVNNKWSLAGVMYQRYWNRHLWTDFFNKMLNVPSCSDVPSLKPFIETFSKELFSNGNKTSFASEIGFLSCITNEGK